MDLDDAIHTEVDLDNVFDVAVTVTKATSAVTWGSEQCVKHVEKKATWQEFVVPLVDHKQGLPTPQAALVQLRASPQQGTVHIG